jgi:hypothetical protein
MDHELSIRTSEKSDEICAAFVAAQADMPMAVGTDGTNPHFKSKYTTLAAISKAVRPVFANHGIGLLPSAPNGNMALRMVHTSGQWMEVSIPFTVAQPNNPQAIGSAITYARRYLLGMVSGVPSDEDDDGNAASAPPPKPKEEPFDHELAAKKLEEFASGYSLHGDALEQWLGVHFGRTAKNMSREQLREACQLIKEEFAEEGA